MKKAFLLILALCMVLSLVACGAAPTTSSPTTTETPDQSADSGDSGSNAASNDTAEGPTYNWSIANVLASGAPWAVGLDEFAARLSEYSDGRMTLTVHNGGVLGSEIETLESVQMGTLDMAICSVSSLSGFTTSQNVFDLPYLFKSDAAAFGVLDSEIGQGRLDAMADAGYKGLGYFYNGTYAIGSSTSIVHPSDLEGVRVRSHASKVQSDSFSIVGAFPVSVAWGDIYTSLQQGTIDAVSGTTLTNMYSGKFYEQTPYIAITGHHYSPSAVVMNLDLWSTLSAEDQEIVQKAFNEAMLFQRDYAVAEAVKCQEEIEASGVQVTEVDRDEWAEAMAPVYDTYMGQNGITQELVDSIKTAAEQYYK